MQPCKAHWTAMKERINILGLSGLCAKTPEEAHQRTLDDLHRAMEHEEANPKNYDPLMAMLWAFCNRVISATGLLIFTERLSDDGMPENRDDEGDNHYCPLCIVRHDFDSHLAAAKEGKAFECGNPQCSFTASSVPWDEEWIASCGDYVFRQAKERGLVVTN